MNIMLRRALKSLLPRQEKSQKVLVEYVSKKSNHSEERVVKESGGGFNKIAVWNEIPSPKTSPLLETGSQ